VGRSAWDRGRVQRRERDREAVDEATPAIQRLGCTHRARVQDHPENAGHVARHHARRGEAPEGRVTNRLTLS